MWRSCNRVLVHIGVRGLLRGGAEDGQLFGVGGLSEVCRRGEAYFDIQNMLSVEQDF